MHNSVLNDLKNLASKDLTNATAMPKELYSSNEILRKIILGFCKALNFITFKFFFEYFK